MKILSIKNRCSNRILNFGNIKVSDYIIDRNKTYPVKSANRENFEYTNFPLEEDATNLPSKRFLHSDTFRQDELLELGEKEVKNYVQYSIDDVPLSDDLRYDIVKNKNINLYGSVTSHRANTLFNESVHSPWIDINYLERRTKYKEYLENASQKIIEISNDRKTVRQIFDDCTILKQGKFQVDKNLLDLATGLLENSEEKSWGETEHAILKELKIPIFKKTYGAIYAKKYNIAKKLHLFDKPNVEILTQLKKINPIDIYGLRTIL